MEKRLILAIGLSILIILSWSALAPKTQPIDNKAVISKGAPVFAPAAKESPLTPALTLPISSSARFTFSDARQEVVFVEPQGAVQEVKFKGYQNYKFPLQYAFLCGAEDLAFAKTSASEAKVVFAAADKEKRIKKEFIFSNSNYTIELNVTIQNVSGTPLKADLPLLLGALNFDGKQSQVFQDVVMDSGGKILRFNGRKDMVVGEAKFIGIRDRYFCAIIEPSTKDYKYSAFIRKVNPTSSQVGLQTQDLMLMPGQSSEQKFRIYLGPQDLQIISRVEPEWTAVVNFGTFDLISQFLLRVLDILYRLVRNWGGAVVLLSILIYLLLFPLSTKQMRSMKEMQALQPHIEELRRKYKDNPQRMNKETMELYREHKVNPFGGCLPLLLQLPIFFALYQAIMRSIALKGAHFLWIKDLSEPDRLFLLPVSLPLLGNELNILPILMAIGMFIQQKISLRAATPASAEQQKMMLIMMPVLFGIIFYHMPAALVLYWFVNSTLTLLYQLRISRQAK